MNMTGAQSMVRCLEEEDVSHIFGYPGATICPFYEALYHSESISIFLCGRNKALPIWHRAMPASLAKLVSAS